MNMTEWLVAACPLCWFGLGFWAYWSTPESQGSRFVKPGVFSMISANVVTMLLWWGGLWS